MIGDLHCHSCLSDGAMDIDELVLLAKRVGLDVLSVTDHDTMDGVARAQELGARHGVRVLPGVELSCFDGSRGRKAHLLCYLPDKPERLEPLFRAVLDSRAAASAEMIRRVTGLYPVTEARIRQHAAGSKAVYKVHIMRALVELGYDGQVYGALYKELFGRGGPCHVGVDYPEIRQAIDRVHSAGGIAVLAHPLVYRSIELLEELAGEGLLDGVEVNHPSAAQGKEGPILEIAARYRLLRTGGSDFHGAYTAGPRPLGGCTAPGEWIEALCAAAGKSE